MSFDYGDKIKIVRTYDAGVGLYEGAVVEVGYDDGQVAPSLAESLCRASADEQGAFAEPVTPEAQEDEGAGE